MFNEPFYRRSMKSLQQHSFHLFPNLLATIKYSKPLELLLEPHNLNSRRETVSYTLEEVFIPSIINRYVIITEK